MPIQGLVLVACLALTAPVQDLVTLDSSSVLRGLGDVDGDGHADFAYQGRLFSGKSGEGLATPYLPDSRGVGDLNGDGADDVAFFEDGRAVVYSVRDRERIRVLDHPALAAEHTGSLASVPDVTGDGVPEVLVAVPDADAAGLTRCGAVWLCSGADGTLARAFTGTRDGERLGRYASGGRRRADGTVQLVLAGDENVQIVELGPGGGYGVRSFDLPAFGSPVGAAGDVDGDDCIDLLLPGSDEMEVFHVRVVSGVDGTDLRTLSMPSPGRKAMLAASKSEPFSWEIRATAGVGDLDGDGKDDIALADPVTDTSGIGNGSGSCTVFSGATGLPLLSMGGQELDGGMWHCHDFGWALAPAGDVDADGRPDILVAADCLKRLLFVYSGRTGIVHEIDL